MDVFECIKRRHSTRKFLDKDLEEWMIKKIIEAGMSAPSAGGLRSQQFFVVKDKQEKEVLSRMCFDQGHVAQAPVVIVVFSDEERIRKRYGERAKFYAICDGSASTQNILLVATALGLGSCWVGAFDDEALKEFFSTSMLPVSVIPIGYPL